MSRALRNAVHRPPNRPRAATVPVLALLALAALGGCAARQEIRGGEAADLDRKYTTFSWIEEGDLVTLVVNTKAARYREDAAYVPLEIALANTGLRRLTLSRESFTLLDAAGNRYPLASPRELLENYTYLDMDADLRELGGIMSGNKFAAFSRYPSKFSPDRRVERGESDLVRDRLTLPRYGYIVDQLYFPRPAGDLVGGRFELFVDAPELENPVFVKFEVK